MLSTLSGPKACRPFHCLAWGEKELPSLPLGHGGGCLWAGTWPSNYHNFTNFHSLYLQQGPGPCDGLQEEGHDQQHQYHHAHLDAKAARMETRHSRILVSSGLLKEFCRKSFAERVLRKEFVERVRLAADWVLEQCRLSNRFGGMSCSLCKKSYADWFRNWQVPFFKIGHSLQMTVSCCSK